MSQDLSFGPAERPGNVATIHFRMVVEGRPRREHDHVGAVPGREGVGVGVDGVVDVKPAESIVEVLERGVDLGERVTVPKLVEARIFRQGVALVREVVDGFREGGF